MKKRDLEERVRELKLENARLKAENTRLEDLSLKDPLTGLYNQKAFEELLEKEIVRSRRYGGNGDLSIIYLDLDNFKKYNDTLSHLFGNNILCGLASIIVEECRMVDIPARWGGDEFVIILPNTKEEGAKKLADRIRCQVENKLAKRYAIPDETVRDLGNLTVSVGVAYLGTVDSIVPEFKLMETDNIDAVVTVLTNSADQAMYRAKYLGGNRVYVCDRETLLGT